VVSVASTSEERIRAFTDDHARFLARLGKGAFSRHRRRAFVLRPMVQRSLKNAEAFVDPARIATLSGGVPLLREGSALLDRPPSGVAGRFRALELRTCGRAAFRVGLGGARAPTRRR